LSKDIRPGNIYLQQLPRTYTKVRVRVIRALGRGWWECEQLETVKSKLGVETREGNTVIVYSSGLVGEG